MLKMPSAQSFLEHRGEIIEPFAELERGVETALETYSNVHRGSGHFSMVTTHLYEQARVIVLEYLNLNKDKYVVIFCTPKGADTLKTKLKPGSYHVVSSNAIGLPLGVRALAVVRRELPRGAPFHAGGGTARLVAPGWVIWDNAPDKFEAGTPSIINVIALARALCMIRQYQKDIFPEPTAEKLSADEILYHDDLEKYTGRELLDKLRQSIIGRGIQVPTREGDKPFINLDNSASTPTFLPVWNAVRQTWHLPGQTQQDIIHKVRSICAEALGASPDTYDLIFTSNTTEAINLATESLSRESEQDIEPVILNTLLEHTSNDLPWRMVPHFSLVRLQADTEGFLDLNELDTILSAYNQTGQHGNKRIRLMAVSGASNVLGSFNNMAEISRIVHKYGARLLVDAAQLIAHRKIGMDQCGIDYLTFSAHKVYAPFGTGVLVVRKGLLNFNPAEMDKIQSSGEENAGGIAALGKALVLLKRIGMELIQEEEQALTRQTLLGLKKINGIRIYGITDPASPRFAQKGGVIVFTMKGFMSDKVAKELAELGGIGIRYGCHCAHILVKHILGVPPSLERFQKIIARLFSHLRFPGVARVSLGIGNSKEEVANLIEVLSKIASGHRSLQQKETISQINDFVKAAALRVYS